MKIVVNVGEVNAMTNKTTPRTIHDNDCEGSTDICCCYIRRELNAAKQELAKLRELDNHDNPRIP